ncbi:MAG TPA: NCS2 family permease [Candidatus Krumholzibacteria bacterium]|nr:NCS2 family permease [Candidatus Krumholzibacteria bacterium]HPD72315.1 NCS2 family permease [Candidatus Krumholzibacteria bacterium]HRY40753.1 NCS2 family permease [Candidatus Krumholzibacteria bacterium]
MLDRLFKLTASGTTVGREAAAGLTTYLTMAYIVFVNPDILADAGMDRGALITVTILAAAAGTLMAGLWANVPYAMAPGMGLNAYFAYSLVIGQGVAWQTALGVVFFSGLIFLILTIIGVRRLIVEAIPVELRLAIAAGIGLFITVVGLQKLGLIVASPTTLVQLGEASASLLLGLAGLALTIVLTIRRVPGAILLGIVATTLLGMVWGEVDLPSRLVAAPPSPAPIFLQLDLGAALQWGMAGAIFTFMFLDLFDSVGTIVACSYEANLVREDGTIERLDRVLGADALATMVGAALGTSTTTTYIESGAGIAAGGRTGLASVFTTLLLLATLVLTPFIGMVPGFATAPALIMVGVFMFKSASRIDFARLEIGIPAFLMIVLMPLTYSISMGLAFGFLAAIAAAAAAGNARRVHPMLWVIGGFSAVEIAMSLG